MLDKISTLILNLIAFICFTVAFVFQLLEAQTYVDRIMNLFN